MAGRFRRQICLFILAISAFVLIAEVLSLTRYVQYPLRERILSPPAGAKSLLQGLEQVIDSVNSKSEVQKRTLVQLLLMAARSKDWEVAYSAVSKLCEFKTDQAVNGLRILAHDKSVATRVRAVALEHISYTGKISLQDVKLACGWLSSDDVYLRKAASSLLWVAGGEVPCPSTLKQNILKALYTAFAKEKNSDLKAQLLSALCSWETPTNQLRLLRKAVHSPDSKLRLEAVIQLAILAQYSPEAKALLKEASQDSVKRIRQEALSALQAVADIEKIRQIIGMMRTR